MTKYISLYTEPDLDPPSDSRYQYTSEYVSDLTFDELVAECGWEDYDFERDDNDNPIYPARRILEDWLIDKLYWKEG